MNEEHPTGFRWCRLSQNEDEAKVCRAHAIFQGLCGNLINALKVLANQQKDGDSPIQNIIMGLKEKSRERISTGLRSITTSDNYSERPAVFQGSETENEWRQFRSSKRRSG